MEDFKNTMKEVIKRRIVDQATIGSFYCLGCMDNTLAHDCGSTMLEKIEAEFNGAFFWYMVHNREQVKERLSRAILIEILADELPRDQAVAKANEISYHDFIRYGGGVSSVSSTTKIE